MSVEIPKAAVVFGSVTPPQGDIIDLKVHLGCTKEVSSFSCLLQNWDKKYSPGGTSPINVGDDGHINIGRGSNVPQIITCRVESVKCESTPNENYIRVSGRCWGERIFRRVVTKVYENKKGEDIVRDLVDYYIGLDHCRENSALTSDAASGQYQVFVANASIFSVGMLVKIKDDNAWEYNEIDLVDEPTNCLYMKNVLANTYTVAANGKVWIDLIEKTDTTFTELDYENSPVFDILKYIAESVDKSGVIGYDFRVAPDAKFQFFPKNSKTSPVSLSEKIEVSQYRKDIHRIRNKIKIYGLADKSVPADKDAYTETLDINGDLTDDWTSVTGSGTVSLDAVTKVRGDRSVKHTTEGSDYYGGLLLTLPNGYEVDANKYPILSFFALLENYFSGHISISLHDSADKAVVKWITLAPGEWHKTDTKVGLENESDWESWDPGFDWSSIKKFRIDCHFSGVGTGSFWIDGFYFGGRRYSATREDATSQTNYGLRELVEVDEELVSDNECDLRAKALLDYFKNPAEYLRLRTSILDYGNDPLLPGDKIHVTLPNENVDDDYRIESCEYRVDAKTQTLEITLELGKVPPFLADYLYGMRATTVTVEKLARTKLGKGAIPTALGGGLGAHHVGHEAGDDNGAPWATDDDGGWDKITGWICPKHIGPYEDAASIIKFRTKNKAGTAVLDHQFQPSDNEHGVLGCETAHWKEMHSKFMVLYHGLASPYGDLRIKVQGEDNPKTRLTEELLEFGPGGLTAPDVYLKRIVADKLELKAQYLHPLTDNLLELGAEDKKLHKVFTTYLTLLTDGYMQIKTVAEANPKAKLSYQALEFGPGGTTAPDAWLKRVASGQVEVKSDLLPTADNSGNIGLDTKRWAHIHAVEIHVSNMLFNFNLLPDADNTYDLGSSLKKWKDLYLSGAIKALDAGVAVHLLPNATATYDLGSATKKWSNLYVNGVGDLGSLNVGGFTVITSARVLQNVTADAAIITSGQFPLARMPRDAAGKFLRAYGAGYDPMYAFLAAGDIPNLPASKITSGQFPLARLPRGTSGYVLEAQGAGFDSMYVNPNGRYAPAGHNHAAGDITSGVLAEARCPNVYTGQITFNGGIVTNSVNCANWQATDITFENKFKITEAQKLGLGKGLAFLNPKGKVIMFLDENGNITISGELKAGVKF